MLTDATAAARSELRSRLPFTAVHRTVHRPQYLHGSSPSAVDARVPAIQRPSAGSHRTVDNSLIISRIEYSRSSACAPTARVRGSGAPAVDWRRHRRAIDATYSGAGDGVSMMG